MSIKECGADTNVVSTLELARRLAGTPMTAVVVHPGAARTNLQQHPQGALGG